MKALFLIVVLLMSCASAMANDRGYATSADGNLWLIDFTTLTSTRIGNTNLQIGGLAQRSDGVLFGTSSTGSLYTINPLTAKASLVGITTLSNLEALDFNGDMLLGTEYTADSPVYSLNQATGLATPITSNISGKGFVTAAATVDADTFRVRSDLLSPTLYDIDLNTSAVTTFKISDEFLQMFGMDYIGHLLYGVGDRGRLFRIDTVSGEPTIVGDTGDQFYLSFTAVVPEVPEPLGVMPIVSGVVIYLFLFRK